MKSPFRWVMCDHCGGNGSVDGRVCTKCLGRQHIRWIRYQILPFTVGSVLILLFIIMVGVTMLALRPHPKQSVVTLFPTDTSLATSTSSPDATDTPVGTPTLTPTPIIVIVNGKQVTATPRPTPVGPPGGNNPPPTNTPVPPTPTNTPQPAIPSWGAHLPGPRNLVAPNSTTYTPATCTGLEPAWNFSIADTGTIPLYWSITATNPNYQFSLGLNQTVETGTGGVTQVAMSHLAGSGTIIIHGSAFEGGPENTITIGISCSV